MPGTTKFALFGDNTGSNTCHYCHYRHGYEPVALDQHDVDSEHPAQRTCGLLYLSSTSGLAAAGMSVLVLYLCALLSILYAGNTVCSSASSGGPSNNPAATALGLLMGLAGVAAIAGLLNALSRSILDDVINIYNPGGNP